jgi:molybdopterin converting factor small subunit
MTLKVADFHTRFTDGLREIICPAKSMEELMDHLAKIFPAYHAAVYSEGKIPRFYIVFRNDDDIRYLDGMKTTLSENDTVTIMTAFAGG